NPRDKRARAERDVSILGHVPYPIERIRELLGELCPYLVQRPEESSQILHPFEVRDRDTTRIRQDVRQDRDPALGQDLVRLERVRAVRSFGDHPRAQPWRVELL